MIKPWPCSILGCLDPAIKFIHDGAETQALCPEHYKGAQQTINIEQSQLIREAKAPRSEYYREYYRVHKRKKKKQMQDYYINVVKPKREWKRKMNNA